MNDGVLIVCESTDVLFCALSIAATYTHLLHAQRQPVIVEASVLKDEVDKLIPSSVEQHNENALVRKIRIY